MSKQLSLRLLSAVAVTPRADGTLPTDDFLETESGCALEDALVKFHKWWESNVETLPIKARNEAEDTVWDLVNAYEQYAHEQGLRDGVRLALELMRAVPSADELYRRAREREATA